MSVDACVVSFSYGLCLGKEKLKNGILLGGFTGFFQAFMPIIGYFLTGFVKTYIQPFSDLIIFTIFTFLGIKFIIEAFEKEKKKNLCLGLKYLILIGIATSIDAFSAGISLSLLGNKILKPVLLIGLVTFINAMAGFYFGGKLKQLPSKYLEIFAGILLILLGAKSLF